MATDASNLCFLSLASSPDAALAALAPPVASWFRQTFSTPTAAQRYAWPVLQKGENLLLSAPTGTGKTLAAFLPIVSRLWDDPREGLACLYVAPMKALIRDVGKNLRRYLRQMKKGIRVGLRTGDTSATIKRRQWENPPHILLTTPESLAVLLANPQAEQLFGNLRWIVVDEIHALAGNKRGADLALSLERLKPRNEYFKPRDEYSNPAGPQRIGLSATCAPLPIMAQFLVGTGRPCAIAAVPDQSAIDLAVEPLQSDGGNPGFMAGLLNRLNTEISVNQTTLIFTNTRALAERLTWALKRRFSATKHRIAVHHSSIAALRRRIVERQLKKGRLDVVITSASLELGIDIGSVDGVVFVHPPRGVARFLQRLGRSGHRPGQPRRGLLLTSGPAELLEATVTAAAGRGGQLEPLVPPSQPLDVLCQHIVGLAKSDWWTPDDVYRLVVRAYPYRDLGRDDFDQCLAYLSGRHADGRAWLPARLRWENGRFAIVSPGTLKLMRRNLGTILAEERRAVRLLDPQATADGFEQKSFLVGFLDDAYADRLRPGDRLLLDGRCFQYRRCENRAVLVDEVSSRPVVPCWTGSGWSLSRELAQRLFLFRQQAADALREGPAYLRNWLGREYNLGESACSELARLFDLQETMSEIPDERTLLVETVTDGICITHFVHTPLNRPGNDALARVATWRLFRDHRQEAQSVAADLGFSVAVTDRQFLDALDWPTLLAPQEFDQDLKKAVATCASMRERFAQAATIGLMVLRNPVGGRRKVGGHDWVQRRLFDQVRDAAPNFVLLRQAESEMQTEVCDADAARRYVSELPGRFVRCRRLDQISPFAQSWTQEADILDESREETLASLHAELVGAV